MKKSIYLIISLVVLLGAYSCTDENIGSSITDTNSTVIVDSSFVLTGHSVPIEKIPSRTSMQLVGEVSSPGYGKLTSSVVTEFMPANIIDTMGVTADSIKYCRLVLRLPPGGFTGDSVAPMRMSVYKLNKQLPNPIYNDFDPSGYYNPGDLMGSTTYSVVSSRLVDTVSNGANAKYREVYVPFPVDFAKSIFNLYKSNREVFSDPAKFKEHFPGLYITGSYGSGHIMNYYDTELEVYYNKHIKMAAKDTVYKGLVKSYLGATPEVVSNNNVKLEVDDSVKQLIGQGEPIIMGPAGYEVKVRFPIQEIIDAYNRNSSDGISLINKLELDIPVDKISNKYNIEPPQYLLMVKEGKKEEFFAGDSLTNNRDSFYASYNATTKHYTFNGLRKYILNIIEGKNGIADEEDKNMIITPIDVTIIKSQRPYGYYQGNPETTISKIAPAISLPTSVKLRLDKAKIKIVYSKQSVY